MDEDEVKALAVKLAAVTGRIEKRLDAVSRETLQASQAMGTLDGGIKKTPAARGAAGAGWDGRPRGRQAIHGGGPREVGPTDGTPLRASEDIDVRQGQKLQWISKKSQVAFMAMGINGLKRPDGLAINEILTI